MILEKLREQAKQIKLAVFDLDGTLLNPDGQVSEKTQTALKILKRKGIRLCIATGRIYSMTTMYHHLLDDGDFLLTSNGATIRMIGKEDPVQKMTVDPTQAKQVVDFCVKHQIECNIFKHEACYFQSFSTRVKRFESYNEEAAIANVELAITYFYESEIPDYEGIEKLLIIEKDPQKSKQVMKFVLEETDLIHTTSGPGYIDVSQQGISKGIGVQKIAEFMNISPSSICAFGDYDNDISMLDLAGISVVPQNAQPAVFPHANYVTLSNEQDGIALAIHHLFEV